MKLRALKLPSFVAYHGEVATRAEKEGWSFGGLFRLLRNDLQEDFTLIGVEQGWEVWRRKTPGK